MSSRFRRFVLEFVLIPLAFVTSCAAFIPPAVRLVDPMTHAPLTVNGRFFILVVQGDQPHVLTVEDLHAIPPLPEGATYLVPDGKDDVFQRYLNEHDPTPRRYDAVWILKVERRAPKRQRIELYLLRDGYWGGAYDATEHAVTPIYRKITGAGLAFIFGPLAMFANLAVWLVAAILFTRLKRRRTAALPIA